MTDMVPITAVPLALQPDQGRIEITLPHGMTIAEMVAAALPGATEPVLERIRVTLVTPAGMQIVPRAVWHAAKPHAGVHVVIRVAPGKDALRGLLQILVTVAATAISGFFFPLAGLFPLTIGEQIVKGALTLGLTALGGLLINAILPTQSQKDKEERPTYAIGGWKNQFSPDAPVPMVFGRHRYAPPFAASSYIEVVGDVLYNRAVFLWGYGALGVTDLKLGETPIEKYDEIEHEFRPGRADDELLTLYTQTVFEDQVGTDLERPLPRDDLGDVIEGEPAEAKPVSRFTAGDVSHVINILAFPAGLIRIDNKGRKNNWSVRFKRRYRMIGSDVWTDLPDLTVTNKKQAGFYRADRIDLPVRGRYEIEYERLTPSEIEDEDNNYVLNCTWVVLQSWRPEYPFNFSKPVALSALRVKATAQLNGTLDNFNGVVQRLAPDWTGFVWTEQETKSAAAAGLLALRGPALYRPVADAAIDWESFQEWAEFCTEKGLAYNRVHDFDSSFGETIAAIGAAGRAAIRNDGTKWHVVIDRPRSIVVDEINPRNASGITVSPSYFEPPQALRVPFNDETNDYQPGERIIPWPGHEGTIDVTEELRLPGKTNPDEIWIEARRRQYEIMKRAVRYSATQAGTARTATTGDLVMASRDILRSVMHSARVTAVRGNLVDIDGVFTMEEGESYAVRFRRFDAGDTIGESIVRTVKTVAGDTSTLELTGTGEMPEPRHDVNGKTVSGDLVHFGPAEQNSWPLIITSIERGRNGTSILSMLPAAPEIDELTDAEEPPAWSGRVGAEIDPGTAAPATPVVTGVETLLDESGAQVGATVLLRPGTGSPVPVKSYAVDHRLSGSGTWTEVTAEAAEASVSFDGYARGDMVELQARALSSNDVPSTNTAVLTVEIGREIADLPDSLAGFSVVSGPGHALITVTPGANTQTIAIYSQTGTGGTLDEDADLIHEIAVMAGVPTYQVPHGDASRVNRAPNAAFDNATGVTLGSNWSIGSGVATKTAGTSGELKETLTTPTASGEVLRTSFDLVRTAGSIGLWLYPGPFQQIGANHSASGFKTGDVTASNAFAEIAFAPGSTFAGSVDNLFIYAPSATCLAQGARTWWARPFNSDGSPGPLSSPVTAFIR